MYYFGNCVFFLLFVPTIIACSYNNAPEGRPDGNLKTSLQEGNFAIVEWNGLLFPGIAVCVTEEGAVIECMERTKKFWKWPTEKDSLFYKWNDIKKMIQPPRLVKRGLFSVSNM
uniref:Uncharacterized protein n=1 Tax=Graphocephala atropunctata TaxID=36148 RepID=A0A1B6LBN8_9HEMI